MRLYGPLLVAEWILIFHNSIPWKMPGKSMDSGKINTNEFRESAVWKIYPFHPLFLFNMHFKGQRFGKHKSRQISKTKGVIYLLVFFIWFIISILYLFSVHFFIICFLNFIGGFCFYSGFFIFYNFFFFFTDVVIR